MREQIFVLAYLIKKGRTIMNWMDLNELEMMMMRLRKKEFNDLKNKYVKENIQLALKKIKKLKEECLSTIQLSEKNIMDNMMMILKTEAEIVSIIGLATYGDFNKNQTIDFYLEKDKNYIYKDYVIDIDFYAKEYQPVCSLANFYVKFVG